MNDREKVEIKVHRNIQVPITNKLEKLRFYYIRTTFICMVHALLNPRDSCAVAPKLVNRHRALKTDTLSIFEGTDSNQFNKKL